MATHNISYCVVLASALKSMRTGSTMRALKKTATNRGISSFHVIKPVCICRGSYFPRTIILFEYRFRWYGFCLLVPFVSIALTLGNLALLSFYQLFVSLVSRSCEESTADDLRACFVSLQVDFLKSSVEAFQKHVCVCRRSFPETRPPFSRPGGILLLEVRGHWWRDTFQPCKELYTSACCSLSLKYSFNFRRQLLSTCQLQSSFLSGLEKAEHQAL